VATRDNEVVVCEVKARASRDFGDPLEAMTPRKIRRVQRAGHAFLRDWKDLTGARNVRLRFDVASVLGTRLEILEDCY
jgi:Holliday junction resolvase-like predicted endonuclease